MLNPPLSLLSDDLLVSIVEQLAKIQCSYGYLYNLSLADRAFTESCQKYIFQELIIGDEWNISKELTRVKKILEDKPLLANRVRMVELLYYNDKESLFKDPNFASILQLFDKSLMPPHELNFSGRPFVWSIIEDPIFVTRQLAGIILFAVFDHSPFNFPHLPQVFLICPKLRQVFLDRVRASEKSYNNYPDAQCSGRGAPLLEVLEYHSSHTVIEQMIVPPPRFNTPVVLWSNLRVLTLAPHDKEGMAYLQPILNAACNSLEELYLTRLNEDETRRLPLAGLVNLSNLPNLQVFSLCSFINWKTLQIRARRNVVILWNSPQKEPSFAPLQDINIVLGTIPESNRITNLCFDFLTYGRPHFDECLNQNWVEMFNEIIRISGGKPLELELNLTVASGDLKPSGRDGLYTRIMEKAALLSDHPNICTHWWNPSQDEIVPFHPRGYVRTRCRR